MQNALIQALKNHQQFERGTNMGGWLSTIIKNGLKSDYKNSKFE